MRLSSRVLLNLSLLFILSIVFYYGFLTTSILNDKLLYNEEKQTKIDKISSPVKDADDVINIWCIFTKVIENAPLQVKFERLIKSLFMFTSVPLHIHIISDKNSKRIAKRVLDDSKNISKCEIIYSFYNVQFCAKQISDIVDNLMPYFSSQPGTYYSDALFYLSLGLHRIATRKQTKAIMLDCDVQFVQDVLLLYKEFYKFQSTNLFALSHELTPVYRHVLYLYRTHHNTSFGDYLHSKPVTSSGSHIYGFPGFNSGVMLFNFSAIRESTLYPKLISKENVKALVKKFSFKGHLGDQDFYTILGYEYPQLFRILPCNFNRQLCVWWRDHGYSDVFANYSKCDGNVFIYHGNCNTPIPV